MPLCAGAHINISYHKRGIYAKVQERQELSHNDMYQSYEALIVQNRESIKFELKTKETNEEKKSNWTVKRGVKELMFDSNHNKIY